MRTRAFVVVAVAVFAAIVGGFLYVALGGDDQRQVGALNSRMYAGGKYGLEIDGVPAGFARSVACGSVNRAPVRSPEGTKQPGPLRYDPCELTLGIPTAPLAGWINSTLAGKIGPRGVSIVFYDFDYKEKHRLELKGAMLTEIVLPALDASSQANATISLKLQPESITYLKGSDAAAKDTTGAAQKAWLQSNFKFQLGTSDFAMASKVSALTFRWSADQGPRFDELTLTVNATDPKFADLEAMLQGMITGQGKETTARITWMSANLADVLGTVDLTGVGMSGGQFLNYSPEGSTAQRRDFAFYVEGASLKL